MRGEGTLLDFLQLFGNCQKLYYYSALSLSHQLLDPSTAALDITINTKRYQLLAKGKDKKIITSSVYDCTVEDVEHIAAILLLS